MYSASPLTDTRGDLSPDFKQYNSVYGATILGSGNGFVYALAPVITPSLTGTTSKTYNGALAATLTGANFTFSGAVDGDSVTLNTTTSGVFADANAGTGKTVSTTGVSIASVINGSATVYGYQLGGGGAASGAIGTINTAAITISTSDVTKTYDGSLGAVGTAIVTSGTLYTNVSNSNTLDSLSGGTFAFTNANAGTGKTVTASGVTVNDGNSGGNYTVSYANNTNSTINKAAITVSTSDVTKTYNGTLAAVGTAVVTAGTLYTNVSNSNTLDSLSGGTFAFTNANAGTGKTVTAAGVTVNDGNSGGNYTVTYADNTNSTINKAGITVSTSDVTKTYDGSLGAAGTAVVTSGTLYTNVSNSNTLDSLSGGTFAFTDANVGTGKTVTASGVTVNDGNSGGNYTVSYADNTNSTINKAAITISTSDVTKTYNGPLARRHGGGDQRHALHQCQQFQHARQSQRRNICLHQRQCGDGQDRHGSGVTVNDGNSGGNYTVSYANNTNSTINRAAITVSTSDVTKTYNGTLAATGTAVVTAGTLYTNASNSNTLDSLSGGTFAFTNANAGTGKTVTASGVTVNDGNSGGNYTVSYADNTNSTINKAASPSAPATSPRPMTARLPASGTAVVTARHAVHQRQQFQHARQPQRRHLCLHQRQCRYRQDRYRCRRHRQ